MYPVFVSFAMLLCSCAPATTLLAVSKAAADPAPAAAAPLGAAAAPARPAVAGSDWTSPTVGLMKWIPAGSTASFSRSAQSIDGFWMMDHELTQAEWQAVMGNNPSHFTACGTDCPVEMVSWDDAKAFIVKVSEQDGTTYRLPSDVEWEFAARGGQSFSYAGSDEVGDVGWYSSNATKTTHGVCGRAKNGYGLCDMTGNVWEWTETADAHNRNDPLVVRRAIRGGCWGSRARAQEVGVSSLMWFTPESRYSSVGFRLSTSTVP